MTRPAVPHRSNLRREIAALAARMIAEDGISDYGFAKRKAARQLGAVNADELPNNAEIDAEVRTYLSVFQDEEHLERQQFMRVAAAEITTTGQCAASETATLVEPMNMRSRPLTERRQPCHRRSAS